MMIINRISKVVKGQRGKSKFVQYTLSNGVVEQSKIQMLFLNYYQLLIGIGQLGNRFLFKMVFLKRNG